MVEKSTRQAEIFERYLGEFVFSDISVEYLARISLYDAEDLGLLGSGWVFSSDDLMEFADQGPMLSELSAKTYRRNAASTTLCCNMVTIITA